MWKETPRRASLNFRFAQGLRVADLMERSGLQRLLPALCILLTAFSAVLSADNTKLRPAQNPATIDPTLKTHSRPLRADVNLVLVPVSVTDDSNRLVTGLEARHFTIHEGDVQQEIRHFSREDAPISLAVIFDVSGSMAGKMDWARQAAIEFFNTATARDEFLLVSVSNHPELLTGGTSSVEEIQNKLVFAVPEGRTALRDAIYLGLERLRETRNPRKAMLILSDGGDNNSRYTHDEIKSILREADIQVYAIGLFEPGVRPTLEERLGPLLLSEMTDPTGGRTFHVRWPRELVEAATTIGIELRNQYVLGYRPENVQRDGKWRKVKVTVNPPKGIPPLRVYGKTGYYAPAD